MRQYVPEEYKAEGGFSVTGLPILLGLMCLTGVGLGWLASFIGQWFYLIVLFPIGMSIGLIGVGVYAVHYTRMHSPRLGFLVGLLSAVTTLMAMHYFDYQRFLDARRDFLAAAPQNAEAVELQKQIQVVDTFPRYMDFQARQGITITSRGGEGHNLGYVGTWIYWGFELAAVTWVTGIVLSITASEPFCSACNQWKEKRTLGTLRHSGAHVAAHLTRGEIEPLQECEPAQTGGNLILAATVCPICEHESSFVLELVELASDEKGQLRKLELVSLTYPGDALTELKAMFANVPDSKAEE